MSIFTVVSLVVGLALLVLGAEFLIRGASKLAATIGVPPLIIGLTVVAFGTSAPELAVSLNASLNGQADIALGNVVGSNICNVLLILGISAVIAPLIVAQQLVRLDVPIMIGVSALLMFFGLDNQLDRSDGLVLFIGGIAYTLFLLVQSRKEKNPVIQDEYEQFGARSLSLKETSLSALLFFLGMAMLVAGSRWLVGSAVSIATFLGASPLIIGLTIIAFGTSLPELATSVMATFRGERDLAVGNVIGSNIFNILVVLGLTSAVSETGIHISNSAQRFDIPVMLAVAIMCLPIFFTDNQVSRREGILLLSYYVLYVGYLVANAADPDSIWTGSINLIVVPLTLLMLCLLSWRTWLTFRRKGAAKE
ncbi:putative K+-dependent Na+/Ca+ exchanger [Synechococcus sp. PCC 7335]|uniref:calcium/sodium antiporter n=1 Tax=Synechococcus sp. (strain ATCC 29403 / PCC 7335) TaxID=91464 RepID=UPI00017ECE86|nr:calcium/sodium antiporter [Synechococcus sp. PCC 7335]EDX87740.1 putative K+-dependent Na+/Ca+ exchanger [Synechococcus sp. PCC 7335]